MENLISTASTAVNFLKETANRFKRNMLGFPENQEPEPYVCVKCGRTVHYVLDKTYNDWRKPGCKDCEYTDIKNYIVSAMDEILFSRGLSKRYLKADLSDFPKGYRKNIQGRGYFIEGSRGVGKTHLAAALMKAEILEWEPCEYEPEKNRIQLHHFYDDPRQDWAVTRWDKFPLFVSASELLLKIRSTFGKREGSSEDDILQTYANAPVLFLDDLGAENASEWATSTLFILINRRYNAELKTYVTSNLSLGELAARLDDRITSRIAEMCDGLKMTGEDRRLQRFA